MSSRTTPVYTRCLESLRRMAADAAAEGAPGNLPTVRDLARQTRASVFTVSRALRELAQEGAVVVVRGRGAYTPAQAALRTARAQAETPVRRRVEPKWQMVRKRVEYDVITGVIARDLPLPSARELAVRYGVSTPTVRRALEPIAAQLGRDSAQSPRPRSSLLLITEADSAGRPVFVNQRNHDFFWQLERECAQRGLSVHLLTVAPAYVGAAHIRHVSGLVNAALAQRTTAAIALVAAGFEDPHGLLTALHATGLPVAVLDERERFTKQDATPRRTPVCIVGMESSELPGLRMGQMLRSRGHAAVAFITDAPSGAWSLQRFAGLHRAFSGTHAIEPVVEFGAAPALDAALSTSVTRASSAFAKGNDRSRILRFEQHQRLFLAAENLRAVMTPVFEDVLRQKRFTAWVAVHDPVALLALEFLAARRKGVPGDIAVAGFDNYLEAQQRDLTSYDFGFERAVNTIVNFACHPRASLFAKNGGKIAIEGALVRRASTG